MPLCVSSDKPMRRTHCVDCATKSGCPLGQLPEALVAQVLPHVTECSFRRGQVLQRQGEEAGVFRVIKSGSALMYRDGAGRAGRAGVPVAIAAAGQVTGASRLVGFPNPLTVIAMADTRTCELDVASLERLGVMDDPAFRRPLGEAVFRTLSILADWARVTRLPGVRNQLAAALVAIGAQQKSERIRLPGQVVLAELLGVTRESVARAMGALENDGLITRVGRTYCELHLPQLKTLTARA